MATWKKSWTKQHDGTMFLGGKGDDTISFDVPSGYEFSSCSVRVISGRKNPGIRITKKPSAGDRRKDRKIKVHWWFDGHQRPFIKYKITAHCRSAVSTIGKNQRALVLICDLSVGGRNDLKWLYEWIESNGVNTVKAILHDDYHKIEVLEKSQATKRNFYKKLSELASNNHYKAIDSVVMLHGLSKELYFRDGSVNVDELKGDLMGLNIQHSLRACFSTACFGSSHAEAMVNGGFRVACGSVGVYANGAFGIPMALSMWAGGASFAECIRAANNSSIVEASDAVAELAGFNNVNSHLNIVGKSLTRITTTAE